MTPASWLAQTSPLSKRSFAASGCVALQHWQCSFPGISRPLQIQSLELGRQPVFRRPGFDLLAQAGQPRSPFCSRHVQAPGHRLSGAFNIEGEICSVLSPSSAATTSPRLRGLDLMLQLFGMDTLSSWRHSRGTVLRP